MKRYEYILLAGLFVYGFVLRIYNLGFQSLWIDESFTINASLAILRHFYPLLESGFVYSGYMFHTYVLAGLFSLFGVSTFVARLPSVVFGSLLIPLIYLFVRYLFNVRVAIIASVLVAFSTLEIAWSRQARSYIILQFFFYLSLFFFLYFVRTRDLKWFYYALGVALLYEDSRGPVADRPARENHTGIVGLINVVLVPGHVQVAPAGELDLG